MCSVSEKVLADPKFFRIGQPFCKSEIYMLTIFYSVHGISLNEYLTSVVTIVTPFSIHVVFLFRSRDS